MLQVWHELWDFVSLFQNSSLSTFHQVMCVFVRKVNPLHNCITIVLGKDLCMEGWVASLSYRHISSFTCFCNQTFILTGQRQYCAPWPVHSRGTQDWEPVVRGLTLDYISRYRDTEQTRCWCTGWGCTRRKWGEWCPLNYGDLCPFKLQLVVSLYIMVSYVPLHYGE